MIQQLGYLNFYNEKSDDLTPSFGSLVIRLANQFAIFHQVKFITSVQLSFAQQAGKARKVINAFTCTPDYLVWWDAFITAGAFSTIPPEEMKIRVNS
jgi:hypothetical protein